LPSRFNLQDLLPIQVLSFDQFYHFLKILALDGNHYNFADPLLSIGTKENQNEGRLKSSLLQRIY